MLPAYDNLEVLAAGESLWHSYGGFGATGDDSLAVVPYSWLHMNDNVMDPFHVQVLHSTFSTVQFVPQFAVMPQVDFFATEAGVCYSAVRQLPDGREGGAGLFVAAAEYHECARITLKAGPASGISRVVPVDDTHYIQAMVTKVPKDTPFRSMLFNGKTWGQMRRG